MSVFLFLGFSVISYAFLSLIHQSISKKTPSSASHRISYGPPSHPIIGCLLSFYRNRSHLLDWYTDLLSGSPTRTIVIHRLGACRTVVTANPDNVEHVLRANFHNYPKGVPFTSILGDLLGCGIFNVDGPLWSTQRKLASHEFSTNSLRDFVVRTLEAEVENRLLPLLQDYADTDRTLDLQDLLRRFAFDTVCQVSLGTDPDCLDLSRPLPPLVTAFENASRICAMRATSPVYLVWKIKRALNIGSEKKLAEAVKLVHDDILDIIRNRKKKLLQENDDQQIKYDGDLLSRFLAAGHSEEMVRDMVISFVMAGRDTTSAAMTWLFWLLAQNSNAEEEIVSEVDSILDRSYNKCLDFEALKEMKFLKACLCESMRLYPSVAWDSKHAAADDVLPDGTPVRKGDRVTYFPYGMGRMEELWGKDRLEFKPDRWLVGPGMEGGAEGELRAVSPYKFPVFQAGPRVCLGKEMAFIQMKYVVASILRRFEIRPVLENRPVYVPLLTAHMAGGLKVVVKKRKLMGSC
ncbi:LOW QUALITY PROTEIN: cytochrome P450 94B3 [Eucalyptus grandis]|uniref:LOW QUALITY PROTEIN: cytochrome P450 94B3 n=1 Tax=Eucalyptus grandis TaxID=71139 RepID=UPI00192E83D4|nr:LOW QUALITY PROTEIN: cytochrome P450 94B3 [Eucalyptus grandis]